MSADGRLLPDVLSQSARRFPAAPAVEFKGAAWSYGLLDETASTVAGFLASRGVAPGDRVGICLAKGPETVAALFGILRAGAVFVPMDRAAPAPRLAAIGADSGLAAVFGSGAKLRSVLDAMPAGAGRPIGVDLAADAGASAGGGAPGPAFSWADVAASPPMAAPPPRRDPGDLAYILYTSGSTGVPKGVMISHVNALAFTSWARARFEVGPGDRVSSVAPFHFDLSTFDLYSTLEGGATVVLVPEETALFPAALARLLESERITISYLVPSAVTGMLLHGDLEGRRLGALRQILFAGEVFPARYLSMVLKILPHVRMFNLYGPTETNVCTYYEVKPEDEGRTQPVPIGIPASGDVVFALDEAGEEVRAPGREGELFAAGPTVALGYWNDAERTRRSFIEGHPLAPDGWRAYRTGDRVSLAPSGDWLYHGRRDHMVKSRGYRIELGDIEAAFYTHPEVAEAVAIPVADEEVGSRIKVCVVLKPGARADTIALQRHCGATLPHYMVPEFVELLPELPKTSNGKIDRVILASTHGGRRP